MPLKSYGKYRDIIYVLLLLALVTSLDALSTKKGLCVSPERYLCHDLDHFTNIHWWYDWTLTSNYQRHKHHCTDTNPGHIPMVWGKNFHNDSFPSSGNILLGFNEPNIKDQSNMMPQEAARLWKIVEALNPGKTLVAPAPSQCHRNCNVGDAKHWYLEFFKYCPDCHVDYLATHVYVCDPQHVMHVLHDLWTTFQKPIWLTEFSCPQTHSAHRQLEFMKALLPQLESAAFVHRYSWFAHRFNGTWVTSSTNLVAVHNNHLTPLGVFYNNF